MHLKMMIKHQFVYLVAGAIFLLLPNPASPEPMPSTSASAPAFQPITDEVARRWHAIDSETTTPDGRWLIYRRMTPRDQSQQVVVVVRSTGDQTERRYEAGAASEGGGQNLTLSPSGRWLAFTSMPVGGAGNINPQLQVVDVETGVVRSHGDVRRFEFAGSAEREWLAVLEFGNAAEAVRLKKDHGERRAQLTVDIQATCRNSPEWFHCPSAPESESSGTLVVMAADGSGLQRIPDVRDFAFDRAGARLAVVDIKGLSLRELTSGTTRLLERGGRYVHLTWSQKGRSLAVFRREATAAPALLVVTGIASGATPKRQLFTTPEWPTFPKDYVISDQDVKFPALGAYWPRSALIWRDDERGLFFGIRRRAWSASTSQEDKVVLWHGRDARLPGAKLRDVMTDRQFSQLAYVSLKNGHFVRLADETLPYVDPHRSARWLVGYDSEGSVQTDTASIVKRDYYLVDVETGRRQLLRRQVNVGLFFNRMPRPRLSPDGSIVVYVDHDRGSNYFAYDVVSGKERNLTEKLPAPFFPKSFVQTGELNDVRNSFFHPVGWTRDGAHVLVADGYDVWALPLAELKEAINLTGNGKRSLVRYSLIDLAGTRALHSPERKYQQYDFLDTPILSLDSPLYFAFEDETSRQTGLARHLPGHGLQVLAIADAKLRYMKAGHALLVNRQTSTEFPDWWTVGTNWLPSLRLTNANPQAAGYRLPRAQLVRYTTSHGDQLQGILYPPADYQAGQSYPTIVSIYEKQDHLLHQYLMPGEHWPVRRLLQQGYAVLLPSIAYRMGDTGSAALEGVTSAIHAAVKTGIVDRDRLGLTGHSYGGFGTNIIVSRTKLFKAAVSSAGISNWTSVCGSTYDNIPMQFYCTAGQGRIGFVTADPAGVDAHIRNSPLFNTLNVNTPLLMIHGKKDTMITFHQSVEWFNALRALEKGVVLLEYREGGHVVDGHTADQIEKTQQFFDHYLKEAPAPRWWAEGVSYTYTPQEDGQ